MGMLSVPYVHGRAGSVRVEKRIGSASCRILWQARSTSGLNFVGEMGNGLGLFDKIDICEELFVDLVPYFSREAEERKLRCGGHVCPWTSDRQMYKLSRKHQ